VFAVKKAEKVFHRAVKAALLFSFDRGETVFGLLGKSLSEGGREI
jgi:hypothetical protein